MSDSERPRTCAGYGEGPSDALSGSQTVAQGGGGPTTHAGTRDRQRAFAWPCERRHPHEPHIAYEHSFDCLISEGECDCTAVAYDCPGMRAHPNTMIGKP